VEINIKFSVDELDEIIELYKALARRLQDQQSALPLPTPVPPPPQG